MSCVLGSDFEIGDKIRNQRGLCGEVVAKNPDGTYDVTYKDKQWDKSLPKGLLRRGKVVRAMAGNCD